MERGWPAEWACAWVRGEIRGRIRILCEDKTCLQDGRCLGGGSGSHIKNGHGAGKGFVIPERGMYEQRT